MKNFSGLMTLFFFLSTVSWAQQIQVSPAGANVNSSNPTTVFLTFGPIRNFRPAEAVWCGEITSAAPARGSRCVPGTIYGAAPARYDLTRNSGNAGLTDIMSIPASVVRRAYQAAQGGGDSTFFYVRHFVNLTGGPDEYIPVSCRLSGGGARTPLSLTDVRVFFAGEAGGTGTMKLPLDAPVPAFQAEILYTGTGRLKGRWEIVKPGDELPEEEDLLTEASLPLEERGKQRRYTPLGRFNLFLPPTGRVTVPGPDPKLVPANTEGAYQILLRIEASDDREGDSSLSAVGVGADIVHSAAVAGFPMPVLRYFVGSLPGGSPPALLLLHPAPEKALPASPPALFSWVGSSGAALYRLEIENAAQEEVLVALLPATVLSYWSPSWLPAKVPGKGRWRVVALNQSGSIINASDWREFSFLQH